MLMKQWLLIMIMAVLCLSNAQAQTDSDGTKQPARLAAVDKINAAGVTFTELYPNPSHGTFTAEYSVAANVREVKLSFFNVLGAVVAEETLSRTDRHAEINLTRLNPGVYFYTLSVDGNNQFTKRVVIKR